MSAGWSQFFLDIQKIYQKISKCLFAKHLKWYALCTVHPLNPSLRVSLLASNSLSSIDQMIFNRFSSFSFYVLKSFFKEIFLFLAFFRFHASISNIMKQKLVRFHQSRSCSMKPLERMKWRSVRRKFQLLGASSRCGDGNWLRRDSDVDFQECAAKQLTRRSLLRDKSNI